MPTFILKKYEPQEEANQQASADHTSDVVNNVAEQTEKQAEMIEVSASDSISKIVAQALYKAMPNIEIIQKEQAEADEKNGEQVTKVISSEDINNNPVDTLQSLGSSKCVVILNNGFKTAKEEWFLQSIENRGIKAFYSVTSFVKHVQKTLA